MPHSTDDPSSSTTFAQATAVNPLSSHTYSGNFPRDWVIGNVPHGGLVTSTFLRVAATHFTTTLAHLNQPKTTTLHLTFLRRTRIGPAVFTVRDVKLGRGTSTIHISLRQPEHHRPQHRHEQCTQGEELVVGYLTHTGVSIAPALTYGTPWVLHPAPPPRLTLTSLRASRHASLLTPSQNLLTSAHWAEHPSLPFSDFRRASQRCRFLFPRNGQCSAGVIDQWVSLRSGERWDNEGLGFVVDMFPQVVESLDVPGIYDLPGTMAGEAGGAVDSGRGGGEAGRAKEKPKSARHWYPTVLLNLDVKKPLPAAPSGPEWLFVRVQAKQVEDGRYDLEVIVMDEEGDLVALSHHVCLVLDAGRNLKRSGKEGNGGQEESGAKL